MKFIHIADVHLGSKIEAKFNKEQSKKRKNEVKTTFKNIVEYASNNDIHLILLSGDIFDSDSPSNKDKQFFYSIIKNNPSIDFLYLKGNHDLDTLSDEKYDNLKTFNDSWSYYEYEDLLICGIELNRNNKTSFYNTLSTKQNMKNVVMLHGQISDGKGGDIPLIKLKNKGIDYLALGHVHKNMVFNLDERGIAVYPGCIEGRGYDEIGPHGFMLVDSNDITHPLFIKMCQREFIEENVDISSCMSSYDVEKKINSSINFKKSDIYRINLIGEISIDNTIDIISVEDDLKDCCFAISLKDKTNTKLEYEKYINDNSLTGEFIRLVINDSTLLEDEKKQILKLGLKVLDGRELD